MMELSWIDRARQALEAGAGWDALPPDALGRLLPALDPEGRFLVVVDAPDRAERLVQALRFFHPEPERVTPFPADDVWPYDGFSPHHDIPVQRLRALQRVKVGGPVVVVAPATALLRRIPDSDTRARGTRVVRPGDRLERDDLVQELTATGYLATARVDATGCYAVRGDVLDVWPAGARSPVRIDFFDDEVEEVRQLDPATQRAPRRRSRVLLLPAREERLDRAALERLGRELGRLVTSQRRGATLRRRVWEELREGIRFSGVEAWLPALVPTQAPLDALGGLQKLVMHPPDVVAALEDLSRVAQERWEALDADERPLVPPWEAYLPPQEVVRALADAFPVRELPVENGGVDLGARPVEALAPRGDLAPVIERLGRWTDQGLGVGVVAPSADRAQALTELLEGHDLPIVGLAEPSRIERGRVHVVVGELGRGFLAEPWGEAWVPAGALLGQPRVRRIQRAHAFFDAGVSHVAELKEGEHVVHRMHGIGLYLGMQRLVVQGMEQDFVRVEYRDGDLLYLPATRLEQLSRYVASDEGIKVRLDRLGGQTWRVRRDKVRDTILSMANDLLNTYAKRELAHRPPHPEPGDLYRALVARFPYEETPDQAEAIAAIHQDMSADVPMDRLLCGDVGYGKTEVALRAVARVVEGGGQVAVLCPTTVLALQHFRRFQERFEGLPVRIGMLSRLRASGEQQATLRALRRGELDIVVGTTALLGRGVRFSRLGLLVIDEEHRFGVRQKERFRKWRAEVDVLSMSATPIPRTLQMGLSGLREMSVMTTPPRDRLSVRTSLATFGRSRIRDAILLELQREGQVYFVHNRVQDIEACARQLEAWVPEARFVVAHGKMAPAELESVLIDFIERRADVLVSSAIIESGVDLPRVNTMIINRADRFGLAQLYQLRGRVGRADRRASCLLLLPPHASAEAKRRVRVLVDHAELGAGFRLAMADLEIRGAGNLLGEAQSGSIDAVGFETWLELLEEAVGQAQGQMERERIDPEVEVPVPAFLPEGLIPDVPERLSWYRRLGAAQSEDEVERLLDQLRDALGQLPDPILHLGHLMRVRVVCRRLGIARCAWLKVRLLVEPHPAGMDTPALERAVEQHPKRFALRTREGAPPILEARFLPQEAEQPLVFLRWVLAQLERAR